MRCNASRWRMLLFSLVAVSPALVSCSARSLEVAARDPDATSPPSDAPPAPDPPDLRTNLLAHWPMNELPGSAVAQDVTGHGYHGVVTGGTFVPGKFGSALHFEQGNEVRVMNFPNADNDWTVALWVRQPADDTRFVTLLSTELVFEGGWELNVFLGMQASDLPAYQFAYYVGPTKNDYRSNNCLCVVAQSQWTHLAAVVDRQADTLAFYRNGVLDHQEINAPPITHGSPTLYMGRWQDTGRLFRGELDDVVIYARALRANEILALASAELPP